MKPLTVRSLDLLLPRPFQTLGALTSLQTSNCLPDPASLIGPLPLLFAFNLILV